MRRILVIEDDDVMNAMLVQMLEKAGHEVVGSRDGKEGLDRFKRESFDLVVTDIVMPEMEGLETILAIKNVNSRTPVIAVSGGGRLPPEHYLRLAQSLGADYAFTKPLDTNTFLCAVRECLS